MYGLIQCKIIEAANERQGPTSLDTWADGLHLLLPGKELHALPNQQPLEQLIEIMFNLFARHFQLKEVKD